MGEIWEKRFVSFESFFCLPRSPGYPAAWPGGSSPRPAVRAARPSSRGAGSGGRGRDGVGKRRPVPRRCEKNRFPENEGRVGGVRIRDGVRVGGERPAGGEQRRRLRGVDDGP